MTVATSIDIANTKTLVSDVVDVYPDSARLLDNIFKDFGGRRSFHGKIQTVKCFEDNSKIWEILQQKITGDVLLVDGGGSLKHALFGGNLAKLAYDNGWAGVIINGCTRDVAEQRDIPIGIKALTTCPRRAIKRDQGEINVTLNIAGQKISPGQYIYADEDGIVIADKALHT